MTTPEELVTYCDCHDSAHLMAFHLWAWDRGDETPELYVSVQLNQCHPWWKRIWIGLGYVAGKRSRYSYGHWDEGSISPESAQQLLALLGRYITLLHNTTTGTSELHV